MKNKFIFPFLFIISLVTALVFAYKYFNIKTQRDIPKWQSINFSKITVVDESFLEKAVSIIKFQADDKKIYELVVRPYKNEQIPNKNYENDLEIVLLCNNTISGYDRFFAAYSVAHIECIDLGNGTYIVAVRRHTTRGSGNNDTNILFYSISVSGPDFSNLILKMADIPISTSVYGYKYRYFKGEKAGCLKVVFTLEHLPERITPKNCMLPMDIPTITTKTLEFDTNPKIQKVKADKDVYSLYFPHTETQSNLRDLYIINSVKILGSNGDHNNDDYPTFKKCEKLMLGLLNESSRETREQELYAFVNDYDESPYHNVFLAAYLEYSIKNNDLKSIKNLLTLDVPTCFSRYSNWLEDIFTSDDPTKGLKMLIDIYFSKDVNEQLKDRILSRFIRMFPLVYEVKKKQNLSNDVFMKLCNKWMDKYKDSIILNPKYFEDDNMHPEFNIPLFILKK